MGTWRKTGIDVSRAERGVTLMELLIAIAVFGLLMTSIVALFVSSIRAARTGSLAIDAYEESRGAFDVVERDLMTAFTSRDYGDYYNFFGMPYGFTFVGLVRGQRASSADANLARVTYVLRRMPAQPSFETNYLLEHDPVDPDDDEWIDVVVETCSLLRVVELGVEDLDSYSLGVEGGGAPTSWEDWETSGEWPSIGLIMSDLDARHDPTDPTKHISPAIREQMRNALRRELWIRMLAGTQVTNLYTQMWQQADSLGSPAEPPLLVDFGAYGPLPDLWTELDMDPEDYVVADNILFRAYRADDPTQTIETGIYLSYDPADSTVPASYLFFEYGRQEASMEPYLAWPLWGTETNALEYGTPDLAPDQDVLLGTPMVPHIPAVVRMRLTFLLESPYPGAPDFRRRLEQVIDVPTGYVRTKRSYAQQ